MAKDYVPTESGLSSGASGDEVRRLQSYLQRFGYLQSDVQESFSVGSRLEPLESSEEGSFDDATEGPFAGSRSSPSCQ